VIYRDDAAMMRFVLAQGTHQAT